MIFNDQIKQVNKVRSLDLARLEKQYEAQLLFWASYSQGGTCSFFSRPWSLVGVVSSFIHQSITDFESLRIIM